VVIVEVLDAMTDATMVGIVAVEDMTTIVAHLHLTIDVMITDEDLDLDPTHHVVVRNTTTKLNSLNEKSLDSVASTMRIFNSQLWNKKITICSFQYGIEIYLC